MNRLLLGLTAVALLATAVAFSRQQPAATPSAPGFQVTAGEKNPWTSLKPNVGDDQFNFVAMSDRACADDQYTFGVMSTPTVGHRDKIFSGAIRQVNLLQPEFVVTVGDLIEGY